jgi:hypothetical protein
VIIRFSETFSLPAADIYGFFETPAAWVQLFGFAGAVDDRGDGWYAVPLKNFPFPLVAKVTIAEPFTRVRWTFRGFWRGIGEVRLAERPGGVLVEGYEEIAVRWLGIFSPLIERMLLDRQFRRLWNGGWRRLRKREAAIDQ